MNQKSWVRIHDVMSVAQAGKKWLLKCLILSSRILTKMKIRSLHLSQPNMCQEHFTSGVNWHLPSFSKASHANLWTSLSFYIKKLLKKEWDQCELCKLRFYLAVNVQWWCIEHSLKWNQWTRESKSISYHLNSAHGTIKTHRSGIYIHFWTHWTQKKKLHIGLHFLEQLENTM